MKRLLTRSMIALGVLWVFALPMVADVPMGQLTVYGDLTFDAMPLSTNLDLPGLLPLEMRSFGLIVSVWGEKGDLCFVTVVVETDAGDMLTLYGMTWLNGKDVFAAAVLTTDGVGFVRRVLDLQIVTIPAITSLPIESRHTRRLMVENE